MSFDPLYLPTLLLAVALYGVGLALMRRVTRPLPRLLLFLPALALAAPGVLFTLYYAHLFDDQHWFCVFRAAPFTELTAAGMGVLAGMAQALLPKKRLLIAAWAPTALILLLFWLSVPYVKMLLTPIFVDPAKAAWRDGVSMQSTPSTCGPASAATVLRALGADISEAELARDAYSSQGGTENWYLARAIRRRGFSVNILQTRKETWELPIHAVAGTRLNSPTGPGHFIAIISRDGDHYTIGDPLRGRIVISPAKPDGYHFTGFFLVIAR